MGAFPAPASRDRPDSHARPTPATRHGVLAEVLRLVSYRYDLPKTFESLLKHLGHVLDVDVLTLAIPDESRNLIHLRYWHSTEVVQADLPPELPFSDCPSGKVCSTQETVIVKDVANERRWPTLMKMLRSAGVRSYCSVPLTAGDRQIGALSIGSRKRHAFGDHELQLLRQVAIPVAMAVENELIREYANRHDASRDDLRRSEAYLAEAQKLSHTGSWTLDVASDKYVYISDECFRIYGFDPQEGLPTREAVFRRIHPEDSDRVRVRFEKSLREKVDSSDELRIVLPDGTVKHVHVIRHPVLNAAGDVVEVVGTSIDITERKCAEEALALRSFALDNARDAVFLIGEQGRFLYVNEESCRSLGYTREELLGMSVPDIDPDFPMERWLDAWHTLKKQPSLNFETYHRTKDGRVFPVEITAKYLEYGGQPFNLAVARDITERKRAEEALRRSEAYLAEAQRLSHTGSWAWDARTGKALYLSEEWYRIFGFDPAMGMHSAWEEKVKRVDPGDRQRWETAIKRSIAEKCDYELEERICLPDGSIKYLHAVGHPVLNASGDLIEFMGTVTDITDRKRSENELRRSEAQLAHERDRLSLLLEINNHIVSKLEASELFQAVAASMRKHIRNDLTSLWLINKQTGCLERKFLDFPTGRGFLAKANVSAASPILESQWFRLRQPQICSADLAELPPAVREACRAESIVSAVLVPLVGADGPLGLLAMSSRKMDAFSEADRHLLSQIGTQIALVLDNALAYGQLRASHDDLEHQRLYLESEISLQYNFEDIVGKCSAIKKVLEQVAVVAPTDSTVLLHGETGTGKELIARAIHNLSSRRDRTFVRMNCAAIPSGLLESELFGHEKGAFTGALIQRRGRFELADRGSLFLDEIGDIGLELQPKLLRAVQEQEFERLGSARTIHVNVRIIAATHRDLPAMIREGKFREDLFYRLDVFPIEIPPLRERREDIPLLVNHFVTKLSRQMGKKITSIPKGTMEVLTNCPWPGNVRELANFIERAVILSQGTTLNAPLGELKWHNGRPPLHDEVKTLAASEREIILRAIRDANGVIAAAAGKLGMKRTTLNSKMRKLQISRSDLFSN